MNWLDTYLFMCQLLEILYDKKFSHQGIENERKGEDYKDPNVAQQSTEDMVGKYEDKTPKVRYYLNLNSLLFLPSVRFLFR